jgi:hypothetical protein
LNAGILFESLGHLSSALSATMPSIALIVTLSMFAFWQPSFPRTRFTLGSSTTDNVTAGVTPEITVVEPQVSAGCQS